MSARARITGTTGLPLAAAAFVAASVVVVVVDIIRDSGSSLANCCRRRRHECRRRSGSSATCGGCAHGKQAASFVCAILVCAQLVVESTHSTSCARTLSARRSQVYHEKRNEKRAARCGSPCARLAERLPMAPPVNIFNICLSASRLLPSAQPRLDSRSREFANQNGEYLRVNSNAAAAPPPVANVRGL